MNKQQSLDEAELCGSPEGSYLRNPKAKYTAEPLDISIELTIVSKYHHRGRLQKQSLSFNHQFHLQTVYCAFQDSDYGSIHLESPCCSVFQSRKQIQSLLFLSSTSLLFSGAQPADSLVGPGLQIFGLITLPLVINYALLESAEKTQELKVLVRSVRTGHAYNFQDMWK